LWNPENRETLEALPGQPGALAASPKSAQPRPPDLGLEGVQTGPIAWDGVVVEVTLNHRTQPSTRFLNGPVSSAQKHSLHRFEFGSQAFGDGLSLHNESSRLGPGTDVREAQKVEGFRLSLPPSGAMLSGIPPNSIKRVLPG